MATMTVQLPDDVINQFKEVSDNADEIFGGMTRAGAELVWHNVKIQCPNKELASKFKLSKTYKTPSDGGINTKVYCAGYIPFSDPNRKFFSRRGRAGSAVYHTPKGVPSAFLANMYEYGRSTSYFPKHPFFRNAFKNNQIEQEMLKAQKKLSHGLLDDTGGDFTPANPSEVPFM